MISNNAFKNKVINKSHTHTHTHTHIYIYIYKEDLALNNPQG